MVVSIRELANIHFFNFLASTTHYSVAQIPFNMDMNVNSNIIRERSTLSSKAGSRNLSVSLSTLLVLYHRYIENNNDLPDINIWDSIDSSQLSYDGNVETSKSVSKAADTNLPKEGQYVSHKTPALKTTLKP